MGVLVLIRHGQSQWNLENRFTGLTDVSLSEAGKKDSELCGKSLKDFHFDIAFLSKLKRAQETFDGILKTHGQKNLPVVHDAALNERHYGDLQGLNKAETVKKYGEEQVRLWRRSFTVRPPGGESIDDCVKRVMPFYQQHILPEIIAGKTVLVVAHGNSVRPILMHLDGLTQEQTAALEVPLVLPIVYHFEGEKMVRKEERTVPGMEVKSTATIK